MKPALTLLTALLLMPLVALSEPQSPAARTASAASADWIDLGNEGETLYLTAELSVPKRGQPAALHLTTKSGEVRCTIGIDAEGRLTAWLYQHETKGVELQEGERRSLLVRVVSHRVKPDELFVQIGPAGSIPAEPTSLAGWTLVNREGDSQANLSRAVVRGDKDSPAFTRIRVSRNHAALASAKLVEPDFLEMPDLSAPHPVRNPGSALMLAGKGIPQDTHRISFKDLPRIPSQHAVVSDVLPRNGDRVNQHNYLVHHGGKFWAMWSDGPGASRGHGKVPGHDLPGQHISFATSPDGLQWSEIGNLTGPPEKGFGWIARGFWVREGQLLVLASRYRGTGYRGDGLQLHAFAVTDGDPPAWKHHGLVFDNTLNNFPPQKLPSGPWMMSRRDKNANVHVLVGGVKSFDDWESFPQTAYNEPGLAAEEPDWWVLPDGNLAALFRDNKGSGFLYRAFSTDEGRTWTKPIRTNFPDAKSKFSGVRLTDGRYVLVSNPNPRMRDPLTLAVSKDGLVFHNLGLLVGGRHVDYPHVIQHEDALFIAFATAKQTVEVLKVKLSDLDKWKN